MRILLCVLLLCAFGAQAAPPIVSVTPSRTSGTAPLCVTFDATATTDGDTTKPFHDLVYRWSFGDLSPGNWAYGVNTAQSKNAGYGPVPGHCYQTAGSYTWRAQAWDGTSISQTSGTITVTAADTTYTGTATECIANITPVAGFGGCPAGATAQIGTSDFDAALASCKGATKRCLFNKGDTFAASTTTSITSSAMTIGAYGSGTLPIITSTNIAGVISPGSGGDDLRIMDLNITGSGSSDTGTAISITGGNVDNLAILRLSSIGNGTTTNIRSVIVIQSATSCTGCVIQDSTLTDMGGAAGSGYGFFGWLIKSAIQGNAFGPIAANGQHIIRLQPGQKVSISNNTLTTPGLDAITIRANDHVTEQPNADTQYIYVSDNTVVATSCVEPLEVGPASITQNHWIYDVLLERNWILFGTSTQHGLIGQSVRLTVRNNICDASQSTTGRTCFSNTSSNTTGLVPNPDDNQYLNNTVYAGANTGSFFGVILGLGGSMTVTNSVVKNNLGYAPTASSPKLLFLATPSAGITGTTGASGTFGNSSDNQVLNTDPLGDGPSILPRGFRIGTSSYAATGSQDLFPTNYDDFFHCKSSTADRHSGVGIPRTRAICRSIGQ